MDYDTELPSSAPLPMRLKPNQLKTHLHRSSETVYVVSGDEPMQRQEALDMIREQLRRQGYARELFVVDSGFDWSQVAASLGTRSLFAERVLIELRMPVLKATDAAEGLKLLAQYRADPEQALLVEVPRQKKGPQAPAWLRNLEDQGVVVEVWPLNLSEMQSWISERLQQRGVGHDVELVRALVERTEGNLLAASQEIDKLALLCAGQTLDAKTLFEALSDHARYQPDQWLDAALSGQLERSLRILYGLRAEGIAAPQLVWWAARGLHEVARLPFQPLPSQAYGPQANHYAAVRKAASRGLKAMPLLSRLARIEYLSKSSEAGSAWNELIELTACIAGKPLMPEFYRPT